MIKSAIWKYLMGFNVSIQVEAASPGLWQLWNLLKILSSYDDDDDDDDDDDPKSRNFTWIATHNYITVFIFALFCFVNSMRPMVRVLAWHLFCANQLIGPILTICQFSP